MQHLHATLKYYKYQQNTHFSSAISIMGFYSEVLTPLRQSRLYNISSHPRMDHTWRSMNTNYYIRRGGSISGDGGLRDCGHN